MVFASIEICHVERPFWFELNFAATTVLLTLILKVGIILLQTQFWEMVLESCCITSRDCQAATTAVNLPPMSGAHAPSVCALLAVPMPPPPWHLDGRILCHSAELTRRYTWACVPRHLASWVDHSTIRGAGDGGYRRLSVSATSLSVPISYPAPK